MMMMIGNLRRQTTKDAVMTALRGVLCNILLWDICYVNI